MNEKTNLNVLEVDAEEYDWDKFVCRCSALGALFTEPKLKSEKDAGELSATAKAYLIKVYIEEYWGRRKDISTKQMQKGILCEPELIKLLSEIDGFPYEKNTERKTNEWITGEADIVCDEGIIDGKASWDAETFLPNLLLKMKKEVKIDKDYYCQLQGYMWLYEKKQAKLSYGLVNAPESIINQERYWLLSSMDVATEESPEFKIAEMELVKNMTFDDISPKERIISFDVERDEDLISQVPGKVTKAREFLKEFHKLHTKK